MKTGIFIIFAFIISHLSFSQEYLPPQYMGMLTSDGYLYLGVKNPDIKIKRFVTIYEGSDSKVVDLYPIPRTEVLGIDIKNNILYLKNGWSGPCEKNIFSAPSKLSFYGTKTISSQSFGESVSHNENYLLEELETQKIIYIMSDDLDDLEDFASKFGCKQTGVYILTTGELSESSSWWPPSNGYKFICNCSKITGIENNQKVVKYGNLEINSDPIEIEVEIVGYGSYTKTTNPLVLKLPTGNYDVIFRRGNKTLRWNSINISAEQLKSRLNADFFKMKTYIPVF